MANTAQLRVAVVGLGTMGSMTAWQLSLLGADVTGFDTFSAPHDRSSHAGLGRFFRVAYHEGIEYIPALQRAREMWLGLERDAGRKLLRDCGFLTIGDLSSPWLTELMRGVRAYDLPHEIIEGDEFIRRFPGHRKLGPDESAVLDPQGGLVAPEQSIRSALRLAAGAGAVFHSYTKVTSVDQGPEGVTVVTEDGQRAVFDKVIVAAGAWNPPAGVQLPIPIRVDRLFHAWFFTDHPEDYAPGKFLPFMRQSPGLEDYEVGIAGSPGDDGIVRAGATVPYYRGDADPDALDRTTPLDYIVRMSEVLAEYLPGIDPNPIRTAVYMDGYTPDLRPITEAVADNVLVLSGFSGHGFKFAPVVGQLAAQWSVDGDIAPLKSVFSGDSATSPV